MNRNEDILMRLETVSSKITDLLLSGQGPEAARHVNEQRSYVESLSLKELSLDQRMRVRRLFIQIQSQQEVFKILFTITSDVITSSLLPNQYTMLG